MLDSDERAAAARDAPSSLPPPTACSAPTATTSVAKVPSTSSTATPSAPSAHCDHQPPLGQRPAAPPARAAHA
eukprot:476576-Pyramimonas_sp.AAC.1